MSLLFTVSAIVLIVLLLIAFFFAKHLLKWIINSLIGFFGLYGWNVVFPWDVAINVWSVLLVAIFGVVGLFIVVLFHFLGVAF